MSTTVTTRSANWRLFGGGGLLVGGLLWLLVLLTGELAGLGVWLGIAAFILLAIAASALAFGQTGSNGIVGGSLLGKFGFISVSVGFAALAAVPLLALVGVALPGALVTAGTALVGAGSMLAAIGVLQRRVARGVARWIFFIPAVLSLLWMLAVLGVITVPGVSLPILVAAALAVSGLIYLFNKR